MFEAHADSGKREIGDERNGIFNYEEGNRAATGIDGPASREAVRGRSRTRGRARSSVPVRAAQRHRAGWPAINALSRMGPGLWTIEAGLPVAAHTGATPEGDVRADTLPGGRVATTTHTGPYDKLSEAHAAVQQWIDGQGLTAGGAPWECYVTDPADYPDPKDWKTEIFWPLT
jgi:GyrI-like small molecule binding domain